MIFEELFYIKLCRKGKKIILRREIRLLMAQVFKQRRFAESQVKKARGKIYLQTRTAQYHPCLAALTARSTWGHGNTGIMAPLVP